MKSPGCHAADRCYDPALRPNSHEPDALKTQRKSGLFQELQRRNVFRVGAAYLLVSWLLLQIVDVVGPILRLPDDFARYMLFLLIVGLLPALAFAWVFEWTPGGLKRDNQIDHWQSFARRTGRKLDRAIIVILALAVGLLLFDKLVLSSKTKKGPDTVSHAAAPELASQTDEKLYPAPFSRKSIAVLPFVAMSNGPDDDYFSDGLTEEIINALAQAPDLLVTARTSAFHFKGQNLPVDEIARQLGVAHVLEGSVRRAGEQLRVTAQLVRAADGFHLWSETYDRRTEETFAVQTDIAENVAEALNVLLDDALRERMRRVGTRDVEAFIAFQKGVELYERAHQEASQISLLRQANYEFGRAIALAPDLYPAYEYHADLYIHIVFSHAAGILDGQITAADLAAAPDALRRDYDEVIRHARTAAERHNAEFGRTLLLGPWRALSVASERAVTTNGCEAAPWLALSGSALGQAEDALAAFDRMAACDPLRVSLQVQIARLTLWLGQPTEAVRQAKAGLARGGHSSLARYLALGLAFSGDDAGAHDAATRYVEAEDKLLLTRAMLAAIRGDSAASAALQHDFLGKYGADDSATLILEAARGNRQEANRLAGAIDGRPFGHLVLLDAILACACGAPFDLDAVPVFASLRAESGMPWPPAGFYDLPLKDW
jgi:TolB-like protein